MEKVLVSLNIPSVEGVYNIWIPVFLTVRETIPLLVEAVSDLTQEKYISSGTEILCRCNPDIILNPEFTIQEQGIVNGDCLYLF